MTLEQIIADVKAKMASGLAKAADIIAEDTEEQYKSVFDTFYGEYDPKEYARSYSLYNTSNQVKQVSGTSLTAGIRLNPGATVTTHDSPDYVFAGAFGMGIHGTSAIMVGVPGRSTMDRWSENYKEYVIPLIVKSCMHFGR